MKKSLTAPRGEQKQYRIEQRQNDQFRNGEPIQNMSLLATSSHVRLMVGDSCLVLTPQQALDLSNMISYAYNASVELLVAEQENECNGHPAGPGEPMGQTVYCDGSCRKYSINR